MKKRTIEIMIKQVRILINITMKMLNTNNQWIVTPIQSMLKKT